MVWRVPYFNKMTKLAKISTQESILRWMADCADVVCWISFIFFLSFFLFVSFYSSRGRGDSEVGKQEIAFDGVAGRCIALLC